MHLSQDTFMEPFSSIPIEKLFNVTFSNEILKMTLEAVISVDPYFFINESVISNSNK